MRRLITLVVVSVCTATGALYWLHDGDLQQAVEPVVAEWDAELLARAADLYGEARQATQPPEEIQPETP